MVWVIVDRLTKSAHFLVVRMTFTFEESDRLYILKLSSYMEYQSLSYRIGIPGSRLNFGGVSRGPWDTDEDEHSVSSVDERTVKEDVDPTKNTLSTKSL